MGCTLAAIERRRLPKLLTSEPDPEPCLAASKRNLIIGNAGSFVGIALIFGGAFCINRGDAFPGWWALMPTFGTALTIFAGRNSLVNRWILGNKLLVGVGLISYPLYLWHWPLLYFGRILSPVGMSSLTIAGILATSSLLAWLTYILIERPIRFGNFWGTRKVLFLSTCMTGVMVFGLISMWGGLTSRLGLNPLNGEVGKATADWSFYPFQDNYKVTSGFKIDADIVSGRPGNAILFIGDSHMQYYWPRIEVALAHLRTRARPVVSITAGGSPALPNVNQVDAGYACDKFFEFAMQEAFKAEISTVVFSCFWEKYFIGTYPAHDSADIYRVGALHKDPLRIGSQEADLVFADFGQVIGKLTTMGKEVIVILPGPCCAAWSPKAISRMGPAKELTSQVRVARKDFEAFIEPVKRSLIDVVTSNGGKTIDPLDYFEEDGFFYGKTSDGRFRYKDEDHFRPFYVRERASFLDALLLAKER